MELRSIFRRRRFSFFLFSAAFCLSSSESGDVLRRFGPRISLYNHKSSMSPFLFGLLLLPVEDFSDDVVTGDVFGSGDGDLLFAGRPGVSSLSSRCLRFGEEDGARAWVQDGILRRCQTLKTP